MEEIENKILTEGFNFSKDNTKTDEVGFFLYKNYIVSVYRLTSINENDNDEGSFENIYIVYDLKTGKVYNEYNTEKINLFEELPQIDDVLFNYSFENTEEVEKYKKIMKEEVLNKKESSEKYIEALNCIYNLIDESSKEFFKFFLDELK